MDDTSRDPAITEDEIRALQFSASLRGINNVCDVLMYLEEDDTRDVGVIMTLPLFFPFLWFALWRKKRGWFMYATALAIFGYWLWQFFLRYQFCL